MIILETCLLKKMDDCYDYHKGLTFPDLIEERIREVAKIYSGELASVIQQMLTHQERDRPNIYVLEKYLHKTNRHITLSH